MAAVYVCDVCDQSVPAIVFAPEPGGSFDYLPPPTWVFRNVEAGQQLLCARCAMPGSPATPRRPIGAPGERIVFPAVSYQFPARMPEPKEEPMAEEGNTAALEELRFMGPGQPLLRLVRLSDESVLVMIGDETPGRLEVHLRKQDAAHLGAFCTPIYP